VPLLNVLKQEDVKGIERFFSLYNKWQALVPSMFLDGNNQAVLMLWVANSIHTTSI